MSAIKSLGLGALSVAGAYAAGSPTISPTFNPTSNSSPAPSLAPTAGPTGSPTIFATDVEALGVRAPACLYTPAGPDCRNYTFAVQPEGWNCIEDDDVRFVVALDPTLENGPCATPPLTVWRLGDLALVDQPPRECVVPNHDGILMGSLEDIEPVNLTCSPKAPPPPPPPALEGEICLNSPPPGEPKCAVRTLVRKPEGETCNGTADWWVRSVEPEITNVVECRTPPVKLWSWDAVDGSRVSLLDQRSNCAVATPHQGALAGPLNKTTARDAACAPVVVPRRAELTLWLHGVRMRFCDTYGMMLRCHELSFLEVPKGWNCDKPGDDARLVHSVERQRQDVNVICGRGEPRPAFHMEGWDGLAFERRLDTGCRSDLTVYLDQASNISQKRNCTPAAASGEPAASAPNAPAIATAAMAAAVAAHMVG